jgi:putative phage-type endonuclease
MSNAVTTLNEDVLKADAKEYLRWRSKRIGSSDVPAILGKSPFKTARQLCKEKLGLTDSAFFTNLAIELGKRFEDTARANIEMKLDIDFPATICQSPLLPYMSASLDGRNDENKLILEIKCVRGGPTWEKVTQGIVSETYEDQLQHQMWVSGDEKVLFYVARIEPTVNDYRVAEYALAEAKPDKEAQEKIVRACADFYLHMTNGTLPPHSKDDAVEIEDMSAIDTLEAIVKSKNIGNDKMVKMGKEILLKICKETQEHNFYEIGSSAKLKQRTDGAWALTFNKA